LIGTATPIGGSWCRHPALRRIGPSGSSFKAGGPAYLQRFAQEQVISINMAAAGRNASLVAMGDD
jgi:delta 1-pyrroline-5-carboxylate dehydrogenase